MEVKLDNGVTVNTDKMGDKEAALVEALNNLYKVCQQYNITAMARIISSPKKFMGMTHVVNGDTNRLQEEYGFLMETIATFVQDSSGGKLAVMVQE